MPTTDILHDIIATKRAELEQLTAKKPSMRQALLGSASGIIAEFKRRSPSKGWIKEEGRADIIPLSYQQNGAAALSILTDEQYFGGHDDFIRTARQSGVTLTASVQGASGQGPRPGTGGAARDAFGGRAGLRRAGPDLCGINNRNLGSFVTDVENSFRLAERLPPYAAQAV